MQQRFRTTRGELFSEPGFTRPVRESGVTTKILLAKLFRDRSGLDHVARSPGHMTDARRGPVDADVDVIV